jgi:hypothetical protein
MRKKTFTPNKKTKLDIFSMENAKEVFRNPDSSSLLDLVFCFLSFRCWYNFQRSLTFTSLNVPQKLFCLLFGNLNLEKRKKNFLLFETETKKEQQHTHTKTLWLFDKRKIETKIRKWSFKLRWNKSEKFLKIIFGTYLF